MNDSDNNTILKQVQLQKQKAIDLGLMKAIEDLYDDLRYIHVSLQRDNTIWKSCVLEASCLHEEPKLKKIMLRLYNNAEYTVVFSDNSNYQNFKYYDDCSVTGGYELLIIAGEQKVLGIALEAVSDNEFPVTFYRATDVTAFREGSWIVDIQSLHNINRANSKSLLDKIEEERVNKLQVDFGIE